MIYVRTCAYNAEKTIDRTIESILKQTYRDFTYYILDNGSTDRTGEIIRSYAEKDSRIVPFYGKRNHDVSECPDFWSLFYDLQDGDYLCSLDADDVYAVTFLEEILHFATENALDMAACGSVFMDADSWQQCGDRVLHENIVIKNGEELDRFFPEIHWNLRQTWGKLYSAKAAKMPYMVNKPEWYPKAYGGDTVNTLEAVKLSSRIGVLARPLHYYAVSTRSVSNRWTEGRQASDPILFEKTKELLIEKCGAVSKRNEDFLFAVYFHALCDTFRTLFHADLSAKRKYEITEEIFFHPYTQEMFHKRFGVAEKERVDFFVNIVLNLLELWDEKLEDAYVILEKIFSNINPDVKTLLTKESFAWYMEHYPVIVRNLVLREYEYAVNNLLLWVSKKETKPDRDFPFVLGQQLSALRNEEKKYVIFSKQLIRWCIANQQLARAKAELEEWMTMLPGDRELEKLQEMYDAYVRNGTGGDYTEEADAWNREGENYTTLLCTEYNFTNYVKLLAKAVQQCTVIITARDTPWGPPFDKEKTNGLKELGLSVDLFGKFRYAYVAILDEGEVVFEKIGATTKETITREVVLDGESIVACSAGFEADVIHSFTAGSIIINGEEVSARGRGLNIVVYDKAAKNVLDTVNFDTYSSLFSCRHPFKEIERIRRFQEKHRGVELFCAKSPKFPQSNLTMNEEFILKNNVIRETVINNIDKPVFSINKYYDRIALEEIFKVPRSYHDITGVRRFEDVRGSYVNVEGGHRITAYQPHQWERTIFIVGGCSAFGIGAADEHTMASWLQKLLNERIGEDVFCVQNYGYYLCEADRQGEEEIRILESLPVKQGDIIIYYWTEDGISPMRGFPLIDCQTITEQPRACEVFFDKSHLTPDGYRLVAERIFTTLTEKGVVKRNGIFEEKVDGQQEYGFSESQNRELLEYKKVLTNFYDEMISPRIGGIVMNCNPFTLGHRYLIEQALKQCDFLTIFLVEEEGSYFTFEERLKMIEEGTADLPNVAIIPSGRFVISSLTFEEYFNKAELQDKVVDTSLDVVIFAKEIAPCLHITKRFVGEEPFDKVTKQYNEAMKRILPEYGIELIEIPRCKEDGEEISASKVRSLYEKKDFNRMKRLVPETTYRYLAEKSENNKQE